MRGGLRRCLPVAMAVLILLGIALVPIDFCDGNAPGWAENRGGCARWTLLEYAYPWHWGVPDQCLGMCLDASLLD